MGAGLPTAAESRKRPAMAKVTMVFSSIYKIGIDWLFDSVLKNPNQPASKLFTLSFKLEAFQSNRAGRDLA